jgi:lycopene beta-cyclase
MSGGAEARGALRDRYDVAVLGAGCAGLSLLSRLGDRVSAVAFEPRTSFARDRTWCFFQTRPCGFDSAVSHSWPAWKVRLGGREIVRTARGVKYVHIASDDFYAEALRRIAREPAIKLRLGCAATRVERDGSAFVVHAAGGSARAIHVFDARPPAMTGPVPPGETRLLQHFKGLHVRADRDAFDPGVATLMDFDVSQSDGTAFVYALPFSSREALVEATWFSPSTLPDTRYDAVLASWLRDRAGLSTWEVLHSERGVLPMTTESLGSDAIGGAVAIGLRGDCAKPSTGYAFLAIQRRSESIAAAVRAGRSPAQSPARPARTRAVDRVFLNWLARNPSRGAELLFNLFEQVSPASLVRFLSDEGSPADDLAVMRCVPVAEFGLESARTLPRLLRGF